MAMQALTKEQYDGLKAGDVDGFVFPVDHSTDRQFLDDIGRRMNFVSATLNAINNFPPPKERGQPDHQVSLQGGGVIAKGVPADRKIQFFGLPDYEGPGTGPTVYEDGSGDDEEYDEDYEYEYEEEDESRGEENDGMSTLDKVIPVSYTHLTLPTIYSV